MIFHLLEVDSRRFARFPSPSVLSFFLLLLAISTALAQESEDSANLPPGVEIRIDATPETATIGDQITIDFDLLIPEGYNVRFPPLTGQIGDFTVLESFPGPTVPDDVRQEGSLKTEPQPASAGKEQHYRARIIAAVYRIGDVEFPPLDIVLRDDSANEISVRSPTISVKIESVLTDEDQELKDLKKQAEIREPGNWVLWLASALFSTLLAFLAWWFWWRKRTRLEMPLVSTPKLDPFALAEAELRDLLSRGLLEKEFVKQFYVILSDIVRKVLEAGYGIHALEQTTREIMESLNGGRQGVEEDEFEYIEFLLLKCDLVKFAKYIPSRSENDAVIKGAYQVLEECKKHLEPPMPAEQPANMAGTP